MQIDTLRQFWLRNDALVGRRCLAQERIATTPLEGRWK